MQSICSLSNIPESLLLNFRHLNEVLEGSTIRVVGFWEVSVSPLALMLMTALVITIGLLVEVEDLCSSLWLFVSESENMKWEYCSNYVLCTQFTFPFYVFFNATVRHELRTWKSSLFMLLNREKCRHEVIIGTYFISSEVEGEGYFVWMTSLELISQNASEDQALAKEWKLQCVWVKVTNPR